MLYIFLRNKSFLQKMQLMYKTRNPVLWWAQALTVLSQCHKISCREVTDTCLLPTQSRPASVQTLLLYPASAALPSIANWSRLRIHGTLPQFPIRLQGFVFNLLEELYRRFGWCRISATEGVL